MQKQRANVKALHTQHTYQRMHMIHVFLLKAGKLRQQNQIAQAKKQIRYWTREELLSEE